jgi:hypothetical protein
MLEDLMKMIGWNASDLRHANRLSRRRSEKAASLRVLKRLIKAGKLDLTAP